MIVVDKREKNSLVVAELLERNAKIEMKQLEVGDYVIGDIGIERKTAKDFITSMVNKRLLRQLEELKQYPKQLLLIENFDEIYCMNFNENAIRGMLLSILFDFGIPVIFTRNAEDTASFLILLDKKQQKKPREISFKAKKRALSIAEQQQFILEGFPGVGPAIAKELLLRFKTIKNVVNASVTELTKIKKLGKKKAEIIKNLVEKPYDEKTESVS